MMLWNYLLAISCLLFATLYKADAITCYACSNHLDGEKCGVQFGFSGPDDAVNISCSGMACKKQLHTDSHKDIQIVFRGCYNGNETDGLPLMKCKDYMSVGEVCYCDTELCNGRQPMQANVMLIVTVLSPLLFAIMKIY